MLKTKTAKMGLLLATIPVAIAAWYLVSPLFIDQTVDEELVLTTPSIEMPTRSEVQAMSAEKRDHVMLQVMAGIAKKPDQMVQEDAMITTSPSLLKQGRFRDADAVHRGSGDALFYRLPDGSHLLRLENFKVTNGPDLVVYLAKHPDPGQAADVTTGFLSLGKLKGNVGNQNYVVPAGTDISKYKSAVIWCELFGVLFSPAALMDK